MNMRLVVASALVGCWFVLPQQVLGNSERASFRDVSVVVVVNGSDSAEVLIAGAARVAGTVASHLRLPDALTLGAGQQELDSTVVATNSQFSFSRRIHAATDGVFMVDAILLMTPSDSTTSNWFNSYACYVTVENGLITAGSTDLPSEFATSELDTTVLSTYQVEESGPKTITVSISGEVVYAKDCYGGVLNRLVAVPGVKVYIDWDGDYSPAEQWKPYAPGIYTVEGRDFATTGPDGTFAFNFSFSSSKDISELATQLRLYSGTTNDAAVTGPSTPFGTWPAYFINAEGIPTYRTQGLTTQLVSSAARITVPSFNGASLRNLWRAKRYCQGKLAFSPGPIVYVPTANEVSSYNGTNINFAGTPETERGVPPLLWTRS
jgi:hypothetical protein